MSSLVPSIKAFDTQGEKEVLIFIIFSNSSRVLNKIRLSYFIVKFIFLHILFISGHVVKRWEMTPFVPHTWFSGSEERGRRVWDKEKWILMWNLCRRLYTLSRDWLRGRLVLQMFSNNQDLTELLYWCMLIPFGWKAFTSLNNSSKYNNDNNHSNNYYYL